MSPSRRQFLYAFGSAGAGAVYVTLLPFSDDDLHAAGLDQGDFRKLPPSPDAVLVSKGLPPTMRLEDVRCVECGQPLGRMLVDEMQSFNGFNGYACGDCFKDKVDEIEDGSSKEDAYDGEREDLEADLDEVRTEYEALKKKHATVQRIAEQLRWQLVDLRTAPFPPVRQIERMEEALLEFLKGA